MVAPAAIAEQVIYHYLAAAEANRHTPTRQGNLIVLGPEAADEVLISADLHGQRLHFHKLCRLADLAAHPRRHLVLQEICHGGPRYPDGIGCMSHLLLEDVVQLKIRFPQQVHFLLSNHELAEVTDHPISKGGRMLNLQFRVGLEELYGDAAARVHDAVAKFLTTCPLAIRLANRIFICHGSPTATDHQRLDTDVFQRPLTRRDIRAGGAVFQIVWGRDFRPENAALLAQLFDADLLIHGHEPCARGFRVPNPQQIILDCSTPQARYLLLPVGEKLSQAQVLDRIRKLN